MDIRLRNLSDCGLPSEFEWLDIPSFSVISGPNGVGKTQLLSAIHQAIAIRSGEVTGVAGAPMQAHEVAYVPANGWLRSGNSRLEGINIGRIMTQAATSLGRNAGLPDFRPWFDRATEAMNQNPAGMPPERLQSLLPYDFSILAVGGANPQSPFQQSDVLAASFAAYYHEKLRILDDIIRSNKPWDESLVQEAIGEPPWEVVNELLQGMGFRHRVNHPTQPGRDYLLALDDSEGAQISPHQLSSGEKVMMALAASIYCLSRHGVLPKLLLLDEPDAHLHPSLVKRFLDQVKRIFVEQHGCTVIMTTHRPDTIAFAPDGSLWEMQRSPPYIKRATHSPLVAALSSNLISVVRDRKICFVEDESDNDFHAEAYRLALQASMVPVHPLVVFGCGSSAAEKVIGFQAPGY